MEFLEKYTPFYRTLGINLYSTLLNQNIKTIYIFARQYICLYWMHPFSLKVPAVYFGGQDQLNNLSYTGPYVSIK